MNAAVAVRRRRGGGDDDRYVRSRSILPQNLAQRVTVEYRQLQFSDEQRRNAHERLRQRLAAIGCFDEVTSHARQDGLTERSAVRIRVGDEDSPRRSRVEAWTRMVRRHGSPQRAASRPAPTLMMNGNG